MARRVDEIQLSPHAHPVFSFFFCSFFLLTGPTFASPPSFPNSRGSMQGSSAKLASSNVTLQFYVQYSTENCVEFSTSLPRSLGLGIVRLPSYEFEKLRWRQPCPKKSIRW